MNDFSVALREFLRGLNIQPICGRIIDMEKCVHGKNLKVHFKNFDKLLAPLNINVWREKIV